VLVLLTGGEHREKTLHKATATLTLRAITRLAPLHGMAPRTVNLHEGVASSCKRSTLPQPSAPRVFPLPPILALPWPPTRCTSAQPARLLFSLLWHETWNFAKKVQHAVARR
jgi:hypothetical protein